MEEVENNTEINTFSNQNSSDTAVPFSIPRIIGISSGAVALCSIVFSIVIIVLLLRKSNGNFFKWKAFDRFTMYTVVCDLIFYAVLVAFIVHAGVQKETFNSSVSRLSCNVHGVLILEFGFCQLIFSVIMTVYVFNLVTKNRHISLGRFDFKLICPSFGIPLVILVTAALFGHVVQNMTYCGLNEERGFLTWHFITYFLVILLSVVIIAVLYMTMWIIVMKQTTIISTTLQQASAVNTKRLAMRLSLYIVVNAIQFGGSVVEGLWISFEEPPLIVRYVHMFAGVAAGTLNGIVYLTVRRV
ncbi:unnamed protein product [Mytilus coruscus]|uniref:G-protein coupled receptors family 1 profile domain-containing protein n=1 Tax=Mytilus coruscus TaxID=42192 RepID=A0A6J8C650_MYTCO|nr:unnamed protein product [Mytilus coruscus]